MIINIIGTIIGIIIYNIFKKMIKILFIKKSKNDLQKIIDNMANNIKIDKDFWEE